jgi:predicted nuclease of predicted toxin-antitoxin system
MPAPRLLLDEDVRAQLAVILRDRGYDAIHVGELGRRGALDAEVLEYATESGRTVLTHNVSDFVLLDQTWRNTGREHSGIVVSNQLPVGDLLRRTLRFLSRCEEQEIRGRLAWLQEFI